MTIGVVILLYVGGLALVVAEAVVPGAVMGLLGTASLVVSVVYGFKISWALGAGQIVVAVVVAPLCLYLGIRKMMLRSSLKDSVSFAKDYEDYVGREGEAQMDLRPAGIVVIDGRKVDVVTSGELVEKGKRVRVVEVEGNRIVVRAV